MASERDSPLYPTEEGYYWAKELSSKLKEWKIVEIEKLNEDEFCVWTLSRDWALAVNEFHWGRDTLYRIAKPGDME